MSKITEAIAVVLAILFFLISAVLVYLLLHYLNEQKFDFETPTFINISACFTPECFKSATALINKANLSVDPCRDFSQFACGRFYAETQIPDSRTAVDTISILEDANLNILKSIIKEPIKQGEPNYLTNIKRFYESCTDEGKKEAIGLKPYLQDLQFQRDWPTLYTSWSERNFQLNNILEKYYRVDTQPLFQVYVSVDDKNSTRRLVHLTVPSLQLNKHMLRRARDDKVIMALEDYYTKTAVELGASQTVARQDAKHVVDLEIALANIMPSYDKSIDRQMRYNPVTLKSLATMYSPIDVSRAIKALFAAASINLPDTTIVINQYPDYMKTLPGVIGKFTKRTLQNLFGFQYALSRVRSLTIRMRQNKFEFQKVAAGQVEAPQLNEACLVVVTDAFELGLRKEYVDKTFSRTAKAYVEHIVDNLKKQVKKRIQAISWMKDKTKQEASRKVDALQQKIGFPDAKFQEADIEKKYAKYVMKEDDYYYNQNLITKFALEESLKSLLVPVDKAAWWIGAYRAYEVYDVNANEIVFPSGILQEPFFSEQYPDSMNYGAIGVLISRELVHTFDDEGSQFDADGNMRNWFEESDKKSFKEQQQCFIQQADNFLIKEINMKVNGANTLAETVAENGGIQISFRAYKEVSTQNSNEYFLPGIYLTPDQLFFLSYAQMWCEKMTPAKMIQEVSSGEEPIGVFRIISTLQNSEDFAKAFSCPSGSYMNPDKKCRIW